MVVRAPRHVWTLAGDRRIGSVDPGEGREHLPLAVAHRLDQHSRRPCEVIGLAACERAPAAGRLGPRSCKCYYRRVIDPQRWRTDPPRMAIAIDTLAYARRLREAGFSEAQAEGQAQALAAAMTDSLATKQDLNELQARLDARFTQIDARFEHLEKQFDTRFAELEKRIALRFSEQTASFDGKLADLERRLTIRLGGIMVAGVGVLVALDKLV